jgi:hypothetical protein
MISVMSMGQFAVGGFLVWVLLEPLFGINRKAGATRVGPRSGVG